MSEHHAQIRWRRQTESFAYDDYDRTHDWEFGGGLRIQASSAPEYRGRAELPNPEEALVTALSSCHMLTFLAIASRKRFVVDSYEDDAVGTMAKNEDGKIAITHAVLRPRVVFGGERRPDAEELSRMHESAHRNCFIANSVRTEVAVEPREG